MDGDGTPGPTGRKTPGPLGRRTPGPTDRFSDSPDPPRRGSKEGLPPRFSGEGATPRPPVGRRGSREGAAPRRVSQSGAPPRRVVVRRWRGLRAALVAVVLVGGLVVGLLTAIPALLRGHVVGWLESELERVAGGGEVTLDDAEVGLLSTFPTLTVRVHALELRQPNLAVSVADLAVGLDLRSALGAGIVVTQLHAVDPVVRVTLPLRWQAHGSETAYRLRHIDVENLALVVEDPAEGLRVLAYDVDLSAHGQPAGAVTPFVATASVGALTLTTGAVTWLDRAVASAGGTVEWDEASGRFGLKDDRVTVNALPVSLRGMVGPGATFDVAFTSTEPSFRGLLSLVPGAFDDAYGQATVEGTGRVGGTIRGAWGGLGALPAFDVGIEIEDGRYQFPGRATGEVSLDLRLHHPGGRRAALEVDLRSLEAVVADAPLEARLAVKNGATDPDLTARILGTIDLPALTATLPAAPDAVAPTGRLSADVTIDGRMSRFAAGDTSRASASGTIVATDLHLAAGPDLERLTVTLDGARTEVHEARFVWEGSDVALNGTLVGLLPWVLADRGTLTGRLAVVGQHLDLRPIAGDDGVVRVHGVDVELSPTLGKLLVGPFELDGVTGEVILRDGAVRLAPIRGGVLGGLVELQGTLATPSEGPVAMDLEVRAEALDLPRAVGAFGTLGRVAPVLVGATGRVDLDVALRATLGADGTPDLAGAHSGGTVSLHGTTVYPGIARALGEALGKDAGAIHLDGAELAYTLAGGLARLEPVAGELDGTPATVSGTARIVDRTLDLEVTANDRTVKITGPWDQPAVAHSHP